MIFNSTLRLIALPVFLACLFMGRPGFGQTKNFQSLLDSANINVYDTATAFLFLDSAFAVASTPTDKLRIRILKGDILHKNANFNASILLLEESLLEAERLKSDSLIAKASFQLSVPLFNIGNLKSSMQYLRMSERLFGLSHDTLGLCMTWNNLGFINENKGNLDSALYYYQASSNILINTRKYNQAAHAKMNMGYVSQTQENHDLALKYFHQAIELADRLKELRILVYTNLALGNYYAELEIKDSAFYYLYRGESYVGDNTIPDINQYIYSSLGDANKQFKRYDEATKYYLKSLKMYEESGDNIGVMGIKISLGEISLIMGNLTQAKNELENAYMISLAVADKISKESISQLLSKVYSQLGEWKMAYSFLDSAYTLQGSLASSERIEALQELQTKYETEQKDNEIASLSQQAQIQQLLINQRNIQLIGAGIILLLLIIGGSFYYQQRKIRHQQSVSELEQRMLRLQMNPHFIFNALASIQNYILKNDTKESVQLLSKFGRLMRQILEHSRQEYITVAEEIDMLKNYLSIQQLRFKQLKKYTFDVDVDLDVEEVRIPPLFTQPFVENALEHGLVNPEKEGEITIRIKLEANDEVSIEVIDNGQGVINAPISEKSHQSLATSITRERIALLSRKYKRHFNLEVSSNSMGGTTARLIVPGQL